MAGIERLVSTNELKKTRLVQLASKQPPQLFVHYDGEFDALIISLVPLDTETVVHYVDDHVALLYEPEDLEIVGVQVEDFESSYLPKHASVRREWRLSEAIGSGEELEDFGDIVLAVETMKPKVAREVFKASGKLLGPQGEKLVAALA